MRHFIIGSLLALALASCATAKLAPNLGEADYGPAPVKYRETIMAAFYERLFDPESARYRFSDPVRGYVRKAPAAGGGIARVGWIVGVGVNGKNRFGAYVGEQLYRVLIRDEQIITTFSDNYFFSEPWYAGRWPYPLKGPTSP
jgi:hypothetical protein